VKHALKYLAIGIGIVLTLGAIEYLSSFVDLPHAP
jgi:hypothetical protein